MNLPAAFRLRCAPLPVVRIGLVGLGRRGTKTLERYRYLRHAVVTALADLDADRVAAAREELRRTERPEAQTYSGPDAWRELCAATGVDLVYVCTDWDSHTENCCYDRFTLATIEMNRQGLFGELTHFEGAYIHRLDEGSPWMLNHYATHGGNPYPTHGLGPIGWLAGLPRGDRMQTLVSMTATSGGINNTLIRTERGRTILLQLDVCTRRPYSRLQTVCGTRGFARKYPQPSLSLGGEACLTGEAAWHEAERFLTSDAAQRWHRGHELGVPNEMNYAMDSRLIHCLTRGLPLDIDVYDAAEWSCIAELSAQSAAAGSQPVGIPDFTDGHWREAPAFSF